MTIDPRWAIFISLALAIMQFTSASTSLLTDMGFSPVEIKRMLAWMQYFGGVGNLVVAALAGIPSKNNTTGMLTNTILHTAPKPP